MPRQRSGIRSRLEYGAVAALMTPLEMLTLERAVKVGAAVGGLAMVLDRIDRPVAMRNLEIAFPELTRRQHLEILRATYRNWGRMAAEWMHFDEITPQNVARLVTYDGREHWDEAIRRSDGHGILVVTAHFGNFELLLLGHSAYGNKIAVVHRPLRNPLMDEQVIRARTRLGAMVIERKGAARHVVKALREDWMVAIPLDLDTRKGVFVDFFSLKAATNDSAARLAIATGVPVLPAFMVRENGSVRHKITCLPIIEPPRTEDRDTAIAEMTQRCTAAIEQMIRRHPDHWNWVHRRWKTRPRGERRFY
jgi:Kdo2-lipid IVA lauroyltransferase/acyltransferase